MKNENRAEAERVARELREQCDAEANKVYENWIRMVSLRPSLTAAPADVAYLSSVLQRVGKAQRQAERVPECAHRTPFSGCICVAAERERLATDYRLHAGALELHKPKNFAALAFEYQKLAEQLRLPRTPEPSKCWKCLQPLADHVLCQPCPAEQAPGEDDGS